MEKFGWRPLKVPSNERQKGCGLEWKERQGGSWRTLGEGKPCQNIVYEKNLYSIKQKWEKYPFSKAAIRQPALTQNGENSLPFVPMEVSVSSPC